MKESTISNEQLRELQLSELETLKVVLDICTRNNLMIYLSSGTLLGAIRHQGFIPWDDDVDVCMPRKDYNTFREIAFSQLPDKFELCDYRKRDTNDYSVGTMLKVFNKKVVVKRVRGDGSITTSDYSWIDIFPLDGFPDNSFKKVIHKLRLFYRKRMMSLSIWKDAGIAEQTNKAKKVIAKIIRVTHLPQILNLDRKTQRAKLESALQKYDYYKSKYCINMLGDYEFKEIVETQYYGKPLLYDFEDIKAPCPCDADSILKILYGDYMSLPPEGDRVCKHIVGVTSS